MNVADQPAEEPEEQEEPAPADDNDDGQEAEYDEGEHDDGEDHDPIAELHDVVHTTTGTKLAGAAQKRSKHGLLFQGSIARATCGAVADLTKIEG